MKFAITTLILAAAFPSLLAQPDTSERNRRLFTTETFGGNGRTCQTCHTLETGTVSPQDAQERYRRTRATLCSPSMEAMTVTATASVEC